jgi:hypothetical protein
MQRQLMTAIVRAAAEPGQLVSVMQARHVETVRQLLTEVMLSLLEL